MNMDESILSIQDETQKIGQEIVYLQNFYARYLQSPEAKMFFGHENNIIAEDEYLIQFGSGADTINTWVNQNKVDNWANNQPILTSPQNTWELFIKQKVGKLR